MIHFKDNTILRDKNERGISFVISYYKGEKFIFNCIDSIIQSHNLSDKALLFEVIIMIDSVEDAEQIKLALEEKYKHHPIKVFKNSQNLGVAISRNRGLKKITFNFFTIMDQDDYINDSYFTTLEYELSENIPLYLLNGLFDFHTTNRQIPIYYFPPKFRLPNLLLQTTVIHTPGLLVFNKKFISNEDDIFIDTSVDFKGSDDWAAYLRMLLDSNGIIKYKYIPKKIFVYCLHENNFSTNLEQMLWSSLSAISFIEKRAIEKAVDNNTKKIIYRGKRKSEFLIAKNYKKLSFSKLVSNFHKELIHHFFTSFFSLDRYNRLIYRVITVLLAK